jgi:hypothetical protein
MTIHNPMKVIEVIEAFAPEVLWNTPPRGAVGLPKMTMMGALTFDHLLAIC